MATFEQTFTMQEAPEEAQARFVIELGPALHRMGFLLQAEEPGHLDFRVRYMGGLLFLSIWTAMFWLSRKALGHHIEVDFDPDDSGTKVTLSGRTGGDVRGDINVLGRRGHWPENMDDPDWMPTVPADPLREWDEMDTEAPEELGRITRRALKKAGRLP
jgi:hypothetical protein